jgi:zinc transporter ZupT
MSVEAPRQPVAPNRRASILRIVVSAIVPIVLLAGMVYWFLQTGTRWLAFGQLPVEKISYGRVVFDPQEITLEVRNDGPTEVTIAQVLVNDAIWDHTVVPGRRLKRLESARIFLPYDWLEGEPYVFKVISGTGVPYQHEVAIATQTPRFNLGALWVFGVLGAYVGVIPILLGFLWLPFLRALSRRWMDFWLSFTGGLLLFLGIDTFHEALEILGRVPELFNGLMLIVLGGLGAFLGLLAIDARLSGKGGGGGTGEAAVPIAMLVALGIGLHNLGEGLAIGAAYTVGEVALGTFLIVGFTIHNTTEGLAIIAPLIRQRVTLGLLALLGALAGIPTLFGTWIGVFTYSDPLSLLFLGVGGGAIFQVLWVLTKVRFGGSERGFASMTSIPNFAGLMAGFLAMYATAFWVAA